MWVALATSLVFIVRPAMAQEKDRDSLRVYELDAIVITSDRYDRELATSAAAIAVVEDRELTVRPALTVSGVLSNTPGLAFFARDGIGFDPMATVRGFYGGGEVDYVLVLLDGKPMNDVETGLVNWQAIPTSNIESIEVLRGGASAVYGDAGLGAVINVISTDETGTRLSVDGGAFGTLLLRAHTALPIGSRTSSFYGSLDKSDGFRLHGDRLSVNGGGKFDLLQSEAVDVTLSTSHTWTDVEIPGEVRSDALSASRQYSSPFFRFDNRTERRHRAAVDARWQVGSELDVSAGITGEIRDSEAIRTLLLSPEFADTKQRNVATRTVGTSVKMLKSGLAAPFPAKLLLGLDITAGFLDTAYLSLLTGGMVDYSADDTLLVPKLDSRGDGRRAGAALFLQYEMLLSERVRATLGGRYDRIHDRFDPSVPPSEATRTNHQAVSPKVGLNIRYSDGDRSVGNLFVDVGRSFKTPTLDQLFDQRTTPVPFPPFSITFSNNDLRPQFSTNLEGGLYHKFEFVPDRFASELSLVAYVMDVRDELDFDIQQLKFVNIGKSRHSGIEAGLQVYFAQGLEAFANYSYQSVTHRAGMFDGNFLKAVPRDIFSGGVQLATARGFTLGAVVRGLRRMYLDDANSKVLRGYSTFDARFAYRYRAVTVRTDVFNLTNSHYNTTGYPDPAGSEIVYFFPAAGRYALVGLAVEL